MPRVQPETFGFFRSVRPEAGNTAAPARVPVPRASQQFPLLGDLKNFSATVVGILQEEKKAENERDLERGRTFANEQVRKNQKDFARQVNQGNLPEDANPYFLIGAQEVFAQQFATTLEQRLLERAEGAILSAGQITPAGVPTAPPDLGNVYEEEYNKVLEEAGGSEYVGRHYFQKTLNSTLPRVREAFEARVDQGLREVRRRQTRDAAGAAVTREFIRVNDEAIKAGGPVTEAQIKGLQETIDNEIYLKGHKDPVSLVAATVQTTLARVNTSYGAEAAAELADAIGTYGIQVGDTRLLNHPKHGADIARLIQSYEDRAEREEGENDRKAILRDRELSRLVTDRYLDELQGAYRESDESGRQKFQELYDRIQVDSEILTPAEVARARGHLASVAAQADKTTGLFDVDQGDLINQVNDLVRSGNIEDATGLLRNVEDPANRQALYELIDSRRDPSNRVVRHDAYTTGLRSLGDILDIKLDGPAADLELSQVSQAIQKEYAERAIDIGIQYPPDGPESLTFRKEIGNLRDELVAKATEERQRLTEPLDNLDTLVSEGITNLNGSKAIAEANRLYRDGRITFKRYQAIRDEFQQRTNIRAFDPSVQNALRNAELNLTVASQGTNLVDDVSGRLTADGELVLQGLASTVRDQLPELLRQANEEAGDNVGQVGIKFNQLVDQATQVELTKVLAGDPEEEVEQARLERTAEALGEAQRLQVNNKGSVKSYTALARLNRLSVDTQIGVGRRPAYPALDADQEGTSTIPLLNERYRRNLGKILEGQGTDNDRRVFNLATAGYKIHTARDQSLSQDEKATRILRHLRADGISYKEVLSGELSIPGTYDTLGPVEVLRIQRETGVRGDGRAAADLIFNRVYGVRRGETPETIRFSPAVARSIDWGVTKLFADREELQSFADQAVDGDQTEVRSLFDRLGIVLTDAEYGNLGDSVSFRKFVDAQRRAIERIQ